MVTDIEFGTYDDTEVSWSGIDCGCN